MEPSRRIWSAAQCRDEGQRTCHPTHGVDGAAFVPGNTTRAFSCNPHASPLGTLQPPRHTWCVCNALGKARPGASSRLARNRRSAWSKAYSVIDGASRHRSPPRLRRRVFAAASSPHRIVTSQRISHARAQLLQLRAGQHHRRANITGIERHTEDTRIGLVIIHADPSSHTHTDSSRHRRPTATARTRTNQPPATPPATQPERIGSAAPSYKDRACFASLIARAISRLIVTISPMDRPSTSMNWPRILAQIPNSYGLPPSRTLKDTSNVSFNDSGFRYGTRHLRL